MRKEDFWGELRSALSELSQKVSARHTQETSDPEYLALAHAHVQWVIEQALESGILSEEELNEVVAPYVREAMRKARYHVWAKAASLEKNDVRAALTTAISIAFWGSLPYLHKVAGQISKLSITEEILKGVDKRTLPHLRDLKVIFKKEGIRDAPNLNHLGLNQLCLVLAKPAQVRDLYDQAVYTDANLSWVTPYGVKHLRLEAHHSGGGSFYNLQINPRVETLSLCSLAVVIDPKVNWQNLKELYVVEGLGLEIPEGFSLEKLCPELEVFCHLPSRASLFGDVYLKEWLSRKLPETLKVIITSEEDLPETSLSYQRLRRIRPDIRILRIDTTRRIPDPPRALYLAGLKQGIKLQGVAP